MTPHEFLARLVDQSYWGVTALGIVGDPSTGRVRLRPNRGFARHLDLQYDPYELLARLVDQSYWG
jgi:hypothetical protein